MSIEHYDRNKISEILHESPFFNNFSADLLDILSETIKILFVKNRKLLIEQESDTNDGMYFVADGSFEVYESNEDDKIFLSTLTSNQTIGEMSLFYGGKRSANVKALEDSIVFNIDKKHFNDLNKKFPSFGEVLKEISFKRYYQLVLTETLLNIFGDIPNEMHDEIISKGEWIELEQNKPLVHQGDPGDGMYILIRGHLKIFWENEKNEHKFIGEIHEGEIVGEMALITNDPRSAHVYSTRRSVLYFLQTDVFQDLITQYPKSLIPVTKTIVNRLKKSERKPGEGNTTYVAILPMKKNEKYNALSQRLVKSIQKYSSAFLLNSEIINSSLDVDDINSVLDSFGNNINLDAWESDLDKKYDYLFLECDNKPTRLNGRFLRNSDRILFIIDPSTSNINEELKNYYDNLFRDTPEFLSIPKEIIFLYDSDELKDDGKNYFLDIFNPIQRHYNINTRSSLCTDKIARFITGNAVGVVLGGGGARAGAHMGLLTALDECGVPIDIIGGNSGGAIVGALYAYGFRGKELLNNWPGKTMREFSDFTIPIFSVNKGGKWVNLLKNLFGEINIEDLWINYFSVGSNITRAKLEIFNMGPLWFAPCVSANIPIVQPAKIKDGDLIVDGALLNDMPIDIMAKFIGPVLTDTLPDSVRGTIIAENISPPEDMLNVYDYGYHISGLKLLLNKINPFSEKINLPSLIEMLMRINELSSISQRKDLLSKNYAKYYLEPPVGEIGLMEVKKLSEAFKIGYEYSLNQIKKWDL